ncbi:LPO_1073/Vpar_1526 family protein [Bacillus sp. GMa5/1]|uniref:LPO_1073/Vpar_1526 family protein n=1 Tax=Bacillus sp. GMa5/1 TaxID=3418496 RepID=UPI003CEE11A6
MNDKHELSAGENSTNIQDSKNVTVNQYGLNYSDVKEICMMVFKSNFYDLGGTVQTIIEERAEEIINKYLKRLISKDPEALKNTEDADLRFIIYEAQKNHARRGDKEIADLLVDMLIERTVTKEETLVKIVYNEALEILPKLTSKQIDMLTVIFLLRNVNVGHVFRIDNLDNIMRVLIEFVPNEEFFYQHLQYTGCVSINMTSVDFIDELKNAYPSLVPVSHVNPYLVFKENLRSIAPHLYGILEAMNETRVPKCILTSVGVAIALSNFKRKIGVGWDLGTWIKE